MKEINVHVNTVYIMCDSKKIMEIDINIFHYGVLLSDSREMKRKFKFT